MLKTGEALIVVVNAVCRIKHLRPTGLLLAFTMVLQTACAQPSHITAKEVATRLQQATVRIDGAHDRSSGVVISETGLILTVAHGLGAQEKFVRVILNDGTTANAAVVQRVLKADVALLQLHEVPSKAMSFFSPQMPSTKISARQQAVLSSGFPAREDNGQSAVVRIGTILADGRSALRTSCSLTAGDSGGPLISDRGELLGIHQKIGLGHDSNLHLRIQVCLDALKSNAEIAALGIDDLRPADQRSEFETLTPSPRIMEQSRCLTVSVLSDNEGGTPTIFGTIVNNRIVATRLSAIGTRHRFTVLLSDGSRMLCNVHITSRTLDLALLQLEANLPESVTRCITSEMVGEVRPFDLVFSGHADLPGIVARVGHEEPSAKPMLGIELRFGADNAMFVTRISPDSAAFDAGIQIGDQIERLNSTKLTDLDDIGRAISSSEPGDSVVFGIRRNEQVIVCSGRLRHDAVNVLDRAVFLDGRSGKLSDRRTGFRSVIQHDLALTPDELGTPLLDSEGRLVGVSISRTSREAVLAIPMNAISTLLGPVPSE